jgi:hypothetical protein
MRRVDLASTVMMIPVIPLAFALDARNTSAPARSSGCRASCRGFLVRNRSSQPGLAKYDRSAWPRAATPRRSVLVPPGATPFTRTRGRVQALHVASRRSNVALGTAAAAPRGLERPRLNARAIDPPGDCRRLVALKALDQTLRFFLHEKQGTVHVGDKPLRNGVVKKVDQTPVIITDIEQAAWLLM